MSIYSDITNGLREILSTLVFGIVGGLRVVLSALASGIVEVARNYFKTVDFFHQQLYHFGEKTPSDVEPPSGFEQVIYGFFMLTAPLGWLLGLIKCNAKQLMSSAQQSFDILSLNEASENEISMSMLIKGFAGTIIGGLIGGVAGLGVSQLKAGFAALKASFYGTQLETDKIKLPEKKSIFAVGFVGTIIGGLIGGVFGFGLAQWTAGFEALKASFNGVQLEKLNLPEKKSIFAVGFAGTIIGGLIGSMVGLGVAQWTAFEEAVKASFKFAQIDGSAKEVGTQEGAKISAIGFIGTAIGGVLGFCVGFVVRNALDFMKQLKVNYAFISKSNKHNGSPPSYTWSVSNKGITIKNAKPLGLIGELLAHMLFGGFALLVESYHYFNLTFFGMLNIGLGQSFFKQWSSLPLAPYTPDMYTDDEKTQGVYSTENSVMWYGSLGIIIGGILGGVLAGCVIVVRFIPKLTIAGSIALALSPLVGLAKLTQNMFAAPTKDANNKGRYRTDWRGQLADAKDGGANFLTKGGDSSIAAFFRRMFTVNARTVPEQFIAKLTKHKKDVDSFSDSNIDAVAKELKKDATSILSRSTESELEIALSLAQIDDVAAKLKGQPQQSPPAYSLHMRNTFFGLPKFLSDNAENGAVVEPPQYDHYGT